MSEHDLVLKKVFGHWREVDTSKWKNFDYSGTKKIRGDWRVVSVPSGLLVSCHTLYRRALNPGRGRCAVVTGKTAAKIAKIEAGIERHSHTVDRTQKRFFESYLFAVECNGGEGFESENKLELAMWL